MTDHASAGAGASVCPWCSAALPEPAPEACPRCGARLASDGADPVPGVTAIDAEAVLRSARASTRPRGGLLSWIGGSDEDSGPPPPRGSLDPPSADVLEEMRRLALEAELASLRAQVSEIEASEALATEDRVGQAVDRVLAQEQLDVTAAEPEGTGGAGEIAATDAAAGTTEEAVAARPADVDEEPDRPVTG